MKKRNYSYEVHGLFLGWAILVSILPLSSSKEQAIWRLWAEITLLLAITDFTLGFWLAEKKNETNLRKLVDEIES